MRISRPSIVPKRSGSRPIPHKFRGGRSRDRPLHRASRTGRTSRPGASQQGTAWAAVRAEQSLPSLSCVSSRGAGDARQEPAATVPGTTPTCAANRCFAKEVIGWKDTLAQCARALKVGVIDTDIDGPHPAFDGRNIHRFDFAPDGRLPAPNWHGTAVLSLLAGSPLRIRRGLSRTQNSSPPMSSIPMNAVIWPPIRSAS